MSNFKRCYFNGEKSFLYAVIYKDIKIIAYNNGFKGNTKIFLLAPDKKQ